jgi:hypothetical protein
VGQIANSLICDADGEPLLALTSGARPWRGRLRPLMTASITCRPANALCELTLLYSNDQPRCRGAP